MGPTANVPLRVRLEVEKELPKWDKRPRLAPLTTALRKFLSIPSASDSRGDAADHVNLWGSILTTQSAFEVANWVDGRSLMDTKAFGAFREFAIAAGLPETPADYTPAKMVRRVLESPWGQLCAKAAGFIATLRSMAGSLAQLASGLRTWGRFCDAIGPPHFPIEPSVA